MEILIVPVIWVAHTMSPYAPIGYLVIGALAVVYWQAIVSACLWSLIVMWLNSDFGVLHQPILMIHIFLQFVASVGITSLVWLVARQVRRRWLS